ncbi:hypothetical protein AZSP09_03990 [Azospira sp. I09]|nr:hypothetical protein AZSP09_03990 [Azospira sp. I09]
MGAGSEATPGSGLRERQAAHRAKAVLRDMGTRQVGGIVAADARAAWVAEGAMPITARAPAHLFLSAV